MNSFFFSFQLSNRENKEKKKKKTDEEKEWTLDEALIGVCFGYISLLSLPAFFRLILHIFQTLNLNIFSVDLWTNFIGKKTNL